MQQRHTTVNELVSTLCRSKLPTVVVEGKDDMQIFRWMEDLLEIDTVDILGAGGRSNLLAVYDRKSEFDHLPVAFVADRDKELFTQQQIKDAYQLQLRGKLLFQMLARFLSETNRQIKHRIHGLYEIAFKMSPFHPLMDRIIQEIEEKIITQSLTP